MPDRIAANSAPSAVSRRRVMQGAAWAVPVIVAAAAAPAMAASPCDPANYSVRFDTNNYARWAQSDPRYSQTSTTYAFGQTEAVTGKAPVTYTVSTSAPSTMTIENPNLRRAFDIAGSGGGGGNIAGQGIDGIILQQSAVDSTTEYQATTFTFSRPVTNLSFWISDIDQSGTTYRDTVWFSSGFTYSNLGGNLQGTGTQATPFTAKSTATATTLINNPASSVKITYPGPITSFTVYFGSSQTGGASQQIALSNLSLTSVGCA